MKAIGFGICMLMMIVVLSCGCTDEKEDTSDWTVVDHDQTWYKKADPP